MTARLRCHAVRTKPRQKGVALENLTRQGYGDLLPMVPSVGRRRRRSEAPLFPGYLFVGVKAAEQAYGPIRSTFGVVGLVRFGDYAPELPEAVITGPFASGSATCAIPARWGCAPATRS
jgi:transcriptional antiterminator RfaH